MNPQTFIQDDFKVLPNLTINLGLRYERQAGWHEVANRIGTFDPTLTNPLTNTPGAMWIAPAGGRTNLMEGVNVWLPRASFAWSPSSKWAIRGGGGIYSLPWSIDTYSAGALGFGTEEFRVDLQYRPDHSAVLRAEPRASHHRTERMRARHRLPGPRFARSRRVQRPGRELYAPAHPGGQELPVVAQRPARNRQHDGGSRLCGQPRLRPAVSDRYQPDSRRPAWVCSRSRTTAPSRSTPPSAATTSMRTRITTRCRFRSASVSRTASASIRTTSGRRCCPATIRRAGAAATAPTPFRAPSTGTVLTGFPTSTFRTAGRVRSSTPCRSARVKQFVNRGGLLDAIVGGWQVSSLFHLPVGQHVHCSDELQQLQFASQLPAPQCGAWSASVSRPPDGRPVVQPGRLRCARPVQIRQRRKKHPAWTEVSPTWTSRPPRP